jgi:hypothetical protein
MSEQKTTACPVIEGLMSVRLSAPDEDHPAIDTAIRELMALRSELRRAAEWDEYHPAYIEGARVALWYRDNPAKKVTP